MLATGHNLDDEAARLIGNVLHWQLRLPREAATRCSQPTHPRFVRKVRPLFRTSELESATYAFLRGIDYVVEECPNSHGATQLVYKDILNRLEHTMPGSKLAFVTDFLSRGAAALRATHPSGRPRRVRALRHAGGRASSAATADSVAEVGRRRARRWRIPELDVQPEDDDADAAERRALLRDGDSILFIDRKARQYLRTIRSGKRVNVRGAGFAAEELIGLPEGTVLRGSTGEYLQIFRPTYAQLIPNLPRQAQLIYPKDVGTILLWGDIASRARASSRSASARRHRDGAAARHRPDRHARLLRAP